MPERLGGNRRRSRQAAGRHRLTVRQVVGAGVATVLGTAMLLAGTGLASGASTTIKLVTGLGNAGGGKLVTQANKVAKTDLTGPKGSGLTRGITSSSIKVGCVFTEADYEGYQTAIEAEFASVNKKGGIAGRKLTLVTCKTDANSAATNASANQALVSQDTVFAVLSLSELELPASTNYLNSHQVPYFGWGFNPGFCGQRWGFGWNGCLGGNSVTEPIEAIAGNLSEAIVKASGLKPSKVRLAVQANSALAGKVGNAEYAAAFKKIGAKVVYNEANFPATSSGADDTPYVQAMLAAKPNIIYLSTPFTDVGPLAAALKAAGYTGMIMDFTNYIPGLLTTSTQLAAALTGEYVNTQVVPVEQTTAYDKGIATALGAIGKKKFVTLGAYMGYTEAYELVGMLKKVGKTLNTKTFDQKINDASYASYATGPSGGPGKLIWPAAHYLPADCAAIVQVKNAKYKVVEPFSCYQSFKVVK